MKGAITRKRVTKNNIEESIIDLVIVSRDMVNHIESVHIDEDKKSTHKYKKKTKKSVVKKRVTTIQLKLNST